MEITAAKMKAQEYNEKFAYRTLSNDEWKVLKAGGDIEVLAALAGVSRPIITKAVNYGEGSIEVLRIVRDYFEERKKAAGIKN